MKFPFRFPPEVLLLLLAGFLSFYSLGHGSLKIWDESLTAERSLEMGGPGGWLTPSLGGHPDFNKPPLYYWITAGLYKILGVNEWAVRGPSAFFGLCCMALVLWFGRRLGRGAGLWAFLFLLLNGNWMNLTRQGLLDSGFLLGGLGAVALLMGGTPSRWRGAVAGACLAFGSLTKNPAVVLMLAIPVMDWIWVQRRPIPVKALSMCLLVWLLLGVGWYVVELWVNGPEFIRIFYHRNIGERFVEGMPNKSAGPFFYLEQWFELAPLSLILLILAILPWRLKWKAPLSPVAPWVIFSLALLSLLILSASKRAVYLVLIYPMAAVVTGYAVHHAIKLYQSFSRRLCIILLLMGALAFEFNRTYVVIPDYNSELKTAALKIKASSMQGDCILSFRPTAGFMIFYTGLPVVHVNPEMNAEMVQGLLEKQTARIYILVPKDPRPRERDLINRMDNMLGLSVREPWCEGPDYLVYLASPSTEKLSLPPPLPNPV